MGWGAAFTMRASPKLCELNLLFLEEPLQPGDWEGYRMIRNKCLVPLAHGENLHTLEEFRHAIATGCVDFPEPDASNVGGITGFLKVATLAEAFGLPCCSHGMQELHVSLISGISNGGWVEVHTFPIDQYTVDGNVSVENGWIQAPNTPGTGVEFDWTKLEPHLVKQWLTDSYQ